jgi:hypothetical protein
MGLVVFMATARRTYDDDDGLGKGRRPLEHTEDNVSTVGAYSKCRNMESCKRRTHQKLRVEHQKPGLYLTFYTDTNIYIRYIYSIVSSKDTRVQALRVVRCSIRAKKREIK